MFSQTQWLTAKSAGEDSTNPGGGVSLYEMHHEPSHTVLLCVCFLKLESSIDASMCVLLPSHATRILLKNKLAA